MIHAFVKKGSFQDSVSLMLISRKLSESPRVEEVSVMMGTPANKTLLENTGFWHDVFSEATSNDICVAIKSIEQDGELIHEIRGQLDDALKAVAQGQGNGKYLLKARRWASAQQKLPNANLLLISIAGEYVPDLANQALEDGKHVMIFSDNVPLEQEIALKRKAQSKGLIVMGPDCGTAVIHGAPLAFANVLPQGNIGVIGASGTGIQELVSQIALAGEGISHAIGLGGRDLSAEVGGISALSALEMLSQDPDSQVITFVSKPPAESVKNTILSAMKKLTKPVVALFLGAKSSEKQDGNVFIANTLDEAARLAVSLAHIQEAVNSQPRVVGGTICGLYTGGTLASEAAMLLAEQLGTVVDAKHDKGTMLNFEGHSIVDLGDDFYTQGKPHPMIDPATRNQMILDLSHRHEVGVLLLDVVIGYGAHQDPASALVQVVNQMRSLRDPQHPIAVIATVTGTEQDPQCRSHQVAILKEANIAVMNTLPEAILLCLQLRKKLPAATTKSVEPLLNGVAVINAGLRSFAEDLQQSGIPVVHYQWAPIAGGNPKLASLLKQLQ